MAEKSFTFKSDGLVTQQELDALADPIAHRPTVLVIAASDSGGGAGVTADCITQRRLQRVACARLKRLACAQGGQGRLHKLR